MRKQGSRHIFVLQFTSFHFFTLFKVQGGIHLPRYTFRSNCASSLEITRNWLASTTGARYVFNTKLELRYAHTVNNIRRYTTELSNMGAKSSKKPTRRAEIPSPGHMATHLVVWIIYLCWSTSVLKRLIYMTRLAMCPSQWVLLYNGSFIWMLLLGTIYFSHIPVFR